MTMRATDLEGATVTDYTALVTAFSEAGIADAIAPAVDAMAKRVAVQKAHESLLHDGTDVRSLAARVASGEQSLADAAAQRGAIVAARQDVDTIRARAMWLLFDEARRWLVENAVGVLGVVEGAIAEAEQRKAALSRILDGVGDIAAAALAGKKTVEAWNDRIAVHAQISLLFAARNALVMARVIPAAAVVG